MPTSSPGRWIVRLTQAERPRVRLLCIPHAGGGTAAFRGLADSMHEEIEPWAALLPAREGRRRESPERDLSRVVDSLAAALEEQPDLPCALLGHCYGAYTAFELARRLQALDRPPLRVFACAAPGPAVAPRELGIHRLPTSEFIRFLRHQGVTPDTVLADPAIFRIFEPAIRADFELFETGPYRPGQPLDVPITVIGARDDASVEFDSMLHWRRETGAGFILRLLGGDHSFFNKQVTSIAHAVASDLIDRQGRLLTCG
jgi:medium-chain acyl-[acyl-carrier-protein] hydrolase